MRENQWNRFVNKFIADECPQEEEKTICTCNVKENAELIAKILNADSENKAYECCETCINYFSENAAETCCENEE